MPGVKQATKRARTSQAAAVTALGAAGFGLSLTGSASANAISTADIPQSGTSPPISASFLAKRKWPTSVSPRSISLKGNHQRRNAAGRRCCSPRLRRMSRMPRLPWLWGGLARLWWLRRLWRLLRALGGAASAEFHNVARERQEPGELPGRAPLGRRSAMIFRGATCFGS